MADENISVILAGVTRAAQGWQELVGETTIEAMRRGAEPVDAISG